MKCFMVAAIAFSLISGQAFASERKGILDQDPRVTEIEVGVSYSFDIDAFDWHEFKFQTTEAGTYTISVTNTQSYIDWYIWSPEESFVECSNTEGSATCSVDLPADTKIFFDVDEWDDVDSSYDLIVTQDMK